MKSYIQLNHTALSLIRDIFKTSLDIFQHFKACPGHGWRELLRKLGGGNETTDTSIFSKFAISIVFVVVIVY